MTVGEGGGWWPVSPVPPRLGRAILGGLLDLHPRDGTDLGQRTFVTEHPKPRHLSKPGWVTRSRLRFG